MRQTCCILKGGGGASVTSVNGQTEEIYWQISYLPGIDYIPAI